MENSEIPRKLEFAKLKLHFFDRLRQVHGVNIGLLPNLSVHAF